MADPRTTALHSLTRAYELASEMIRHDDAAGAPEQAMRYQLSAAQVNATLWLGELIADLTSAIRETGHRQ